MLTTIIAFFLVLLVLVLVHEWGHFYAAKKTGMVVEEFGFGFPPRLASIKHKGTRYSFNWLPLGGFVKIQGENGDDDREGSFATKPLWARFVVLAAGVVMNLVLAWALLSVALMLGAPQVVDSDNAGAVQNNNRVLIGNIAEGSPAETGGLKLGDVILQIDGEPASSITFVQDITREKAGQETTYLIQRDNETFEAALTPRENPPAGEGALGVQLAEVADVSYPWYEALWQGAVQTWEYLRLTVLAFYNIIAQLVTPAPVQGDFAGPVGIAQLIGRFAKLGLAPLLQFTALLSINLAIINVLPIPALDGGRIVFLGVEAVRGRKVRATVEQWSHAVGFILLLGLMILVTVKDIARIF